MTLAIYTIKSTGESALVREDECRRVVICQFCRDNGGEDSCGNWNSFFGCRNFRIVKLEARLVRRSEGVGLEQHDHLSACSSVVERRPHKPRVMGSSPIGQTKFGERS